MHFHNKLNVARHTLKEKLQKEIDVFLKFFQSKEFISETYFENVKFTGMASTCIHQGNFSESIKAAILTMSEVLRDTIEKVETPYTKSVELYLSKDQK